MLSTTQIKSLIEQMNLEEKVGMVHGDGLFQTKGVKRLGIPPLIMSDGPMGVRTEFYQKSWMTKDRSDDSVTYFPSNTALAATFNPEHAYQFGKALGAETRSRGKDVILGPGFNIIRSPFCGRNFEYMSEDVYHIQQMAVPIVKGIQENDVAACVKHYVANNQETDRLKVNAVIDEFTLENIYLPIFESTIKEGNSYTLMAAYNKLNGDYCCESAVLLQDILRKRWGFEGIVISDWSACHSTEKALKAGLDIEMSVTSDFDDYYFGNPLYNQVASGALDESLIDQQVLHILTVMNQLKMLDPKDTRQIGQRNTHDHQLACLKTAEESIVLLKNDGILPLDLHQKQSIAIIGENAVMTHSNGGGSAAIKALYEHTPYAGISMLLGGGHALAYAKGYTSDPSANKDKQFELREEAIRIASANDIVIFVGGLNHEHDTEGKDRSDYKLPYAQDELIKALAEANPQLICVNISGSAVALATSKAYSKALVQTWYNGMEGGTALAKVLFGLVNPSGRLPFTFAKTLEDYASHSIGQFPGGESVHYSEGTLVGYRHFEANGIAPEFCFGHGLTYGECHYDACELEDLEDTFKINLTLSYKGKTAGKEVVQVYVSYPETSPLKGQKILKAFEKVTLCPDTSTKLSLSIAKEALRDYDTDKHDWSPAKGQYEIHVGSSSRAIAFTYTVSL